MKVLTFQRFLLYALIAFTAGLMTAGCWIAERADWKVAHSDGPTTGEEW